MWEGGNKDMKFFYKGKKEKNLNSSLSNQLHNSPLDLRLTKVLMKHVLFKTDRFHKGTFFINYVLHPVEGRGNVKRFKSE